ncbi:MAG: Hpt domain-containing protein [Rhodospirillales bacterium]|nr:Hpt domain-containing protein [Rhodospirillales bacterium]
MLPSADPLVTIDLRALGDLLGEDDVAGLREVVAFFVESFPILRAQMDEAMAEKDRGKLRNAAHAAKGAARNVCAPGLAAIMEKLEASSPRASWAKLSVLVTECDAAFADVRQAAQ